MIIKDLLNFYKIKRQLKQNLPKKDQLSTFVDEYLKQTQKAHADALNTAEKLNKAALMDQQTRRLKSNIKTLMSD